MAEHGDILQVEGINSKGFGTIPKLVMQDKRLSISAKAIYAYFCSYAGAGKQAFPHVSRIIKDLGISKNNYYKHFNQLRDCGYIKAEQAHKAGRLSHNVYTLCDTIQCTKFCDTVQCTKKQDTVKQDTVFCDTSNINNLENKQDFKNNNHPHIPHGGTAGVQSNNRPVDESASGINGPAAESFGQFWETYPNQKARNAAEKTWCRLNPSPELVRDILHAVNTQKNSRQWLKENGRYIPEPANWLKDKRWLDKPDPATASGSSYDLEEIGSLLDSGSY